MKLTILLLTILISVSSCTGITSDLRQTKPEDVHLHIGDKVKTSFVPYEKCDGIIVDFNNVIYNNTSLVYGVSFYCPNIGWLENTVALHENVLKVQND